MAVLTHSCFSVIELLNTQANLLQLFYIFEYLVIMPNKSTLSYYRMMDEDGIILSYKGVISSDIIEALIDILERKIRHLNVGIEKERRVIRVLVECFQNLYHHLGVALNKGEEEGNNAMIIVKQTPNGFIVRTGNMVSEEEVINLKRRIAMVNALNTDELRELYRKRLKNDPLSSKGTAGLGFIDIARKSKQKLDYDLIEVDEKSSFFCLNVTIE